MLAKVCCVQLEEKQNPGQDEKTDNEATPDSKPTDSDQIPDEAAADWQQLATVLDRLLFIIFVIIVIIVIIALIR